MHDDRKNRTLLLPQWVVDLAAKLVGCIFLEPHLKPGFINQIILINSGAALTSLARRGVAHVEATVRVQIEREHRELEGYKTVQRFFAQNRQERF